MDRSKKKNVIILTILAIIVLIISCTVSFIHNRNIAKEKATKVAIQHMIKEENIDFVVTDVKIEHLELKGFITVSGYDKKDKQERYHVMINKTQNYTIEFFGKLNPN
ncbi:hypothetical protein [Bacillus arachidis]|uniref:hypothetical protein n=1 Tax=Bacillus arachidis TaxID=2819290 RepID=UPI00255C9E2D|nr:hypothetical protein [Bacillus arachidis]WIY59342.1 hypothetical protein QRY57_15755 [Bacillus arachidis]